MTKNPNIKGIPNPEARKNLFGFGCFGNSSFRWRPLLRHLLASLRFYWRSHLGVLFGAVLAAAVLTGSLLVGDSVDGSLRKTALQRLGTIQYAMHTPNRFFAASLADRIPGSAAILQLRGIALTDTQQINQVQVLGVSSNVWSFLDSDVQCSKKNVRPYAIGFQCPEETVRPYAIGFQCLEETVRPYAIGFQILENEVLLGRKLADSLDVKVGDEISLRIEKPGLLPGEAPLASQKDDRTVRARLIVTRILGDDELGRFSLSANQQAPYNAFVNFQWLGNLTELDGKANLIVSADISPLKVWNNSDFGFQFRTVGKVIQLETDQVYLGPEAARAALAVPGARGTLTYLVNSIGYTTAATPYSFVLADDRHALADNEIILNQWLADELSASAGDEVEMAYFELLSNGDFAERTRTFSVHSIVPMVDLEVERTLAPQFPGLSDVDRCADWDVGIPMDEAELENDANEAYWEQYGQTPKAIVSLNAGQEMWANRFGGLTSVRWENANVEVAFKKEYDPAAAGFVFQPVREQALAAVDNAMDFGELFVGMSFFLILSALILTALLFVFSVQQRAEETGILLATGWKPCTVRNLLLVEGGLVALAGSIGGALLGIGYTRLLLDGLSNHWKGAVAGSAIELFASPQTVINGAVASFICALIAMSIAIRRQTKQSARELLVADFQTYCIGAHRFSRGLGIVAPLFCLIVAIGIVGVARVADVQSITMPFFGAGALLLVSGILFCRALLTQSVGGGLRGLSGLALRNVSRRRGRSLTVIGLLACGCFLVFAVSSMKEDVTAHADETSSGTGGFKWFGESTLSITDNLGGVRLRVRDGDDASCLNLNRAQSPRLLGVDPNAMSARKAFLVKEDVWQLLKQELPDGAIPALAGDADTLMWGLEKKIGDQLTIRDDRGNDCIVQLVGMLPMRLSVFQGSLLIAEEQFTDRFPSEEGWRMFLLDERVENRRYERAGLDEIPSVERLLEFYAVESTYLAMFLVLGALGLAVGSMGMGVVVLRNVQDRRSEIALLRAVGYRNDALWKLLFIEHGLLLAAGLGVGVIASAVAMVPALAVSQSQMSAGFLLSLLLTVTACGVGCMTAAIFVSLRRAQILPDSAD